jgi:hypothetical protein
VDKELLLRAEVQEFIKEHEFDDLHALMLQRQKYPWFPLAEIVEQIKSRKKARLKLPTWYSSANILFPQPVSVEQSSSEITAKWKANYIGNGKSGVDLTGGFGIDSYYFAKNFEEWVHVEPNTTLQEVVKHNAGQLGVANTTFYNLSSEDFLNQLTQPVDFIYLDPDRRPAEKRVAGFKDSLPDVTRLLPQLANFSSQVIIKASPMIDITAGLADLTRVNRVLVLSVKNEVKEVLYHLCFSGEHKTSIRCIDIREDGIKEITYDLNEINQEENKISVLGNFLFEPNAAIMKARGQDILASRYSLVKLHHNTNLYTADQPAIDYPGRVFKVLANLPYKKKVVAEYLRENKANLSTRNFIDSPEQMKKKLGVKDGGELYVFGYRDFENKNRVAVCERLNSSAV